MHPKIYLACVARATKGACPTTRRHTNTFSWMRKGRQPTVESEDRTLPHLATQGTLGDAPKNIKANEAPAHTGFPSVLPQNMGLNLLHQNRPPN